MRMRSKGLAGAIAAGAVVACLASVAWANVYPAGVTIDSAAFNNVTGTAIVSYYLNENADGDGTNPGVKIEVLNGSATAVRTVTIARQLKGMHKFEWDGRANDGSRAPNGSYTVKITASDYGYTAWTQLSTNGASTSFYVPVGVAVNKNPASPYYGTTYVSNAVTGTTANTTYGHLSNEGLYRFNPDLSEANNSTAGVTWGGPAGPFKCVVGDDSNLYVSDLSNDLAYEIAPDLSSNVQLIVPANRTTNQWVGAINVSGTKAAGNRKIYLTNTNYNDTARKGVVMYTLGAGNTVAAGDTGTQLLGPTYFAFYPQDFALDSNSDYYACQFRYTANQAAPLTKFLNATPPINTATWEVPGTYTGAYGIDVDQPRNRVAYGNYYTGYVHLFQMSNGAFVSEFDAGSRIRDLAFDAAGNVYTVDNVDELFRVWSPPDGPNSMNVTSSSIALNKTGSGGPVITAHPADVVICPGENATFSVTATGGTLTYQWKKNGTNIDGQTTASLALTAVPVTENGTVYTCVVTDENGVAVSNPALLTVGISFLQVPLNTKVCQNSNAVFTVTVGNAGATYQWQRTTPPGTTYADIVGATSATLTLPVAAADNNTRVRCAVTAGTCGTANSPSALITVSTGPILGNVATSYATPNPRAAGSGATFYAIVVSATGPTTWQWRREGVALVDGSYPWGVVSGANTPNLVVTELNCTSSGSFTVSVTDSCGTTTSNCTAAPGTAGQSCYLTVGNATETCNNGVDDDCDNLVDCADSDCNADPFCGPSCHTPFADWDEDGDVDMLDFADFQRCYAIAPVAYDPACQCFDYNNDGSIDEDDATVFVACGSGPGVQADPACDDRPSGLGKVVINEVAYDMIDLLGNEITDQFEFVELYNRSTETVDISGWILKASDVTGDDNRDFVVPGGAGSGTTLLAPGGYFVFTSPNVPVGAANPPYLNYIIVPTPTDVWENGPDALELLDANKNAVDTVIYSRNLGTVAATGEGSIWGALPTVDGAAQQSASRWFDGWDTDNNGRDFGLRPWTPGANNQGTATVVPNFTLPAIDGMAPGTAVTTLDPSFQPAIVIDPTVNTTTVTFGTGSFVVNPNAITASPQGGKAVVVWDYTSGGGNMVASRALMNNAGGFDLYAYLDTSFTAWGTNVGYESTSYGVMGTTNTVYTAADPDGAVLGTSATTTNGNTGLAWVFNKVKGTSNICKLYLVDAGAGGDNGTWTTLATVDMIAQPSGWYRLSISYNGTTGAVIANGPGGPYNVTTATGLVGEFYVGYREGAPADPSVAGSDITYLRPATFDSAQ